MKNNPIIIQDGQKLRKDLHKIIDQTYNLGYNSALGEMDKRIKSIKLSDFEDSLPQRLLLKDIEGLIKK